MTAEQAPILAPVLPVMPPVATEPELTDPVVLRTELDAALADAVRRAANRAEHIRLTRIQSLVATIFGSG